MALMAVLAVARVPDAFAQGGPAAASTIRSSGQGATLLIDDGARQASLSVTQYEPEGTVWLSFSSREPHPVDPNLSIYTAGDGEIPAASFRMDGATALLSLTTPDTLPVSSCVADDTTGDVACETGGPVHFDLTWRTDGYRTERGRASGVDTVDTLLTRVRSQYGFDSAVVSGAWDGRTVSDAAGWLSTYDSALLFRTAPSLASMMAALPGLRAPSGTGWTAARAFAQGAHDTTRDVFVNLVGDSLQGYVSVVQDERAPLLTFGYAYPDPADPSAVVVYLGQGRIPDGAFSLSAASARLVLSTGPSVPVLRCVITGTVGTPGSVTCGPAPNPVTFDLTWRADGYATRHETSSFRVDEGTSLTTGHHS
jgi:hypothetical protein